MTALLVDVERPVRDWLRGQSLTVGQRVYIGLPTDTTFPAIEVTLLDGGVMPGEAPVANALMSFSVWGNTPGDRVAVAAQAWDLAYLLHNASPQALDATLHLLNAEIVLGPVPRPDPDGTPRYVTDAALMVRVP